MQYFMDTIIFLIGIFFGSFFTLAVYRIPKKEDILIKHSYCPNCHHKLGLLDLFPIFSYLFLKGKCRYCHHKIRPRYFILECLTGVTFVLIAISLRYHYLEMNLDQILYLVISLLYVSVLFIIAGIDKENVDINQPTVYVGLLIEVSYIIYLCIFRKFNIYQYVIYVILWMLILILSIITKKRYGQEKYYVKLLLLSLLMSIFGGTYLYFLTIAISFIPILIHQSIDKNKKVPIGFYLCTTNIIIMILYNVIVNYIL